MTYQARPIELEKSRETLFRLWTTNLESCDDPEHKLRWFYREGPHGGGHAFVVDAGEHPIGCAGLGVRRFHAKTGPVRAALFADLAIDRSHRTGLSAVTLLSSIRRTVAQDFDFGYGFPDHKAVAIYRRAGYHLLGEMPRYVRVLQTRRHLPGWLGSRLPAIFDRSLAALASVRAATAHGFQLRWSNPIDDRYDELWREARAGHPFACERTAAFLRWRYQRGGQIAELQAGSTRKLRAYAVVRSAASGAFEISDLFGVGVRELDALLGLLVTELASIEASSISFRFAGNPSLPRLLASHGFTRRRDTRALVVAGGRRMPTFRLRELTHWYLTDLDDEL